MRFILLALLALAPLKASALSNALMTAPAFQFTCTTSAQRIAPPSGRVDYNAIVVWNAACSAGTCTTSATPVFLGGHFDQQSGAVVSAVTTATGMPICNSSTGCAGVAAVYEVKHLQCIVGSGSVTVTAQVMR